MKIKILLFFCLVIHLSFAQTKEDYIFQYKDLAINEMNKYKIPASITLAQGILESGIGKSKLAINGNNHFGIKCGGNWKGAVIRADDDKLNECFRKYKSVQESYRDHSLFLVENSRYKFLFLLSLTDYKAWAKGLKKAGYATDPNYPQKLIDLIELYNLYEFDTNGKDNVDFDMVLEVFTHQNGIKYVVFNESESIEDLSKKHNLRLKDLLRFNDFRYDEYISKGQIIFLENKKRRSKQKKHKVQPNQDMFYIASLYGLKLKALYKINRMQVGEQPNSGDIIKLKRGWFYFKR